MKYKPVWYELTLSNFYRLTNCLVTIHNQLSSCHGHPWSLSVPHHTRNGYFTHTLLPETFVGKCVDKQPHHLYQSGSCHVPNWPHYSLWPCMAGANCHSRTHTPSTGCRPAMAGKLWQCSAVQWSVQCSAVQCSAVHCSAVHCSAVQ